MAALYKVFLCFSINYVKGTICFPSTNTPSWLLRTSGNPLRIPDRLASMEAKKEAELLECRLSVTDFVKMQNLFLVRCAI